MIEREKLVQWLLNNGSGMFDKSENAETTNEEINNRPFKTIRYVKSEYVDLFMEYMDPKQVEYAIEHNISIYDFNEWQSLQNLLFRNTAFENDGIPFETALKINDALYEGKIPAYELELAKVARRTITSPEEMEREIRKIYAEGYDAEIAHERFDELRKRVLRQFGYDKALNVSRKNLG